MRKLIRFLAFFIDTHQKNRYDDRLRQILIKKIETMNDVLKRHCQDMAARGANTEEILDYFRQTNCSKTKSMAILAETKGINLAEAKELVHFSRTWQDLRDRDEKLHETIEKLLE